VAALMVSISGVRGIVGQSLTPQVIQKYTLAFGTYLNGKKVIVGGDSRTSGGFIRNLVKGCLAASGCEVIDICIVPTPTVQMEILHHQAAGGLAITASHNPPEWNGLKFVDSNSRFLSPAKAEQLFQSADKGQFTYKSWTGLGKVTGDDGANHRHITALLNLPLVDAAKIRKRYFKVVIDCVNGAGGLIIPQLLKELGCAVQVLNGEANGHFAHTAEPLPENLGELCTLVKSRKADIGFAVDPDVDRCAIIDNTGNPIGEEYTLALAVKFILTKKLGPVVVNMSTSRAAEDIARYYNCRFIRTKVGEIHVADEMAREQAVVGGEGNGGVILPDLHLGRDAPLAITLTLQALLESGKTIHDLFLSLPQYKIVKSKINTEGLQPDKILEKIAADHADQPINFLDGLKIDTDSTWVHLRKSNTEPIIRIMAEAPTEAEAQQLVQKYMTEIKALIK
jgi:phosphomannomutase